MLFKELEARFSVLWTQKLPHAFNCVAVDAIFRHRGLSLAVAAEDGKVYVYEIGTSNVARTTATSNHLKLVAEHETKGDALQAMVVHDVTKVHAKDVITCDSRGLLTIFCNGQILSRLSLSNESLDCLEVSEDLDGTVSLIVGGDAGLVAGVQPSKELWRLNLLETPTFGSVSSAAVTCISSFVLPTSAESQATYVLVADSVARVHVINQGRIVFATHAPSIVNAMAVGNYVSYDEPSRAAGTPWAATGDARSGLQIALGCENGAIYIMENFEVVRQSFVKGDHCITKLLTLPVSNSGTSYFSAIGRRRSSSSSSSSARVSSGSLAPATRIHDALVAAGNFDRVHLYHGGRLVASQPTSAWVCSLVPYEAPAKEKTCGIVVGCLDQTVSRIEITWSS